MGKTCIEILLTNADRMDKINCIICNNPDAFLIHKDYPGYVEGTFFDIFNCVNCNSNFIQTRGINEQIYDIIYSNKNVLGYDRYQKYAEQVKHVHDPLRLLASIESTYYSVYKYVMNIKSLEILEVGCGYGYLTYSLNKRGLETTGIDLSKTAIDYAKTYFGENYYNIEISKYSKSTDKKYDLVIATEVIEHVINPLSFILDCLTLLKPNGHILLTTPNKDYAKRNAIWQTDLPPVHTVWLSSKSFSFMVSKLGLKMKLIGFNDYYPSNENRLVRYLQSRREKIQIPILLSNGKPNDKSTNVDFSKVHILMRQLLHNFAPIRSLFNYLFNSISSKDKTLGVIISWN